MTLIKDIFDPHNDVYKHLSCEEREEIKIKKVCMVCREIITDIPYLVRNFVTTCDRCIEKEEKKEEQERRDAITAYRITNYEKILKRIGFPHDRNSYSLKQFDFEYNNTRRAYDEFCDNLNRGRTIILWSVGMSDSEDDTGRGVGKTRICGMAVAEYLVKNLNVSTRKFKFVYAEEFDRVITNKFPSEREDHIKEVVNSGVLIIDDMGYEKGSVIEEILLTRWHAGKQTIITYNGTEQDFKEKYGSRLCSRLHGAVWIQAKGKDYRHYQRAGK